MLIRPDGGTTWQNDLPEQPFRTTSRWRVRAKTARAVKAYSCTNFEHQASSKNIYVL